MPRSGAITLSDVDDAYLTIVCDPCKRRGRYSVRRLREKHGDAMLTDLRVFLSKDCPSRTAFSVYNQCKARFEWANGAPQPREQR